MGCSLDACSVRQYLRTYIVYPTVDGRCTYIVASLDSLVSLYAYRHLDTAYSISRRATEQQCTRRKSQDDQPKDYKVHCHDAIRTCVNTAQNACMYLTPSPKVHRAIGEQDANR